VVERVGEDTPAVELLWRVERVMRQEQVGLWWISLWEEAGHGGKGSVQQRGRRSLSDFKI